MRALAQSWTPTTNPQLEPQSRLPSVRVPSHERGLWGRNEPACKRDSVPGDAGRQPSISDDSCLPSHAAYPKGSASRSDGPSGRPFCLALLQMGFTWPIRSPGPPVGSYSTVSPLPVTREGSIGGLLSVALSCELPRLGVTQHLALWSPDFPRSFGLRGCPAGSLQTKDNVPAPPRALGGRHRGTERTIWASSGHETDCPAKWG